MSDIRICIRVEKAGWTFDFTADHAQALMYGCNRAIRQWYWDYHSFHHPMAILLLNPEGTDWQGETHWPLRVPVALDWFLHQVAWEQIRGEEDTRLDQAVDPKAARSRRAALILELGPYARVTRPPDAAHPAGSVESVRLD